MNARVIQLLVPTKPAKTETVEETTRQNFDFIDPADENLKCYSVRIHELLLRACIEVEVNCKAILTENKYNKPGYWTMTDYKKIQ